MDNTYAIATTISVVYFIIKYIEVHMIKKEDDTLGKLVKDSLVVFLSCLVGFFVLGQVGTILNDSVGKKGGSLAFTDNPTF